MTNRPLANGHTHNVVIIAPLSPEESPINGAQGGTRTLTEFHRGILSPLCLPFHHSRAGRFLAHRRIPVDHLYVLGGRAIKVANLVG